MVRSDKDGTIDGSRSGSVTSSHDSSPVSSVSWLSAKLCKVCVDSRRLMLNLVDEDLVNDSCDGRRSREMLTPESDCNRSWDGDGLRDRPVVPVGRGIRETGRGIPLGGRRGTVLRSIAATARSQQAYKLEDRKIKSNGYAPDRWVRSIRRGLGKRVANGLPDEQS